MSKVHSTIQQQQIGRVGRPAYSKRSARLQRASVSKFQPSTPQSTVAPSLESKTTSGAIEIDPNTFHLPRALDMAAVIFQARRIPKSGQEFARQYADNGTTVQYFNQDIALMAYSGVLKVEVLSAVGPSGPMTEETGAVKVTCGEGARIACKPYEVVFDEKTKKTSTEVKGETEIACFWLDKDQKVPEALIIDVVDGRVFDEGKSLCSKAVPLPTAITTTSTAAPQQLTCSLDGGYEVKLSVSTIPLKHVTESTIDATVDALATADELDVGPGPSDVAAELESMMLMQSIVDCGGCKDIADDNPDLVKGLPESDRWVEVPLYKAARRLGDTFEGGFWRSDTAKAAPLAFIENQDTLTQVLVYWNPTLKQIAVSFPGTDVAEKDTNDVRQDIVTDLNIRPVRFNEHNKGPDYKSEEGRDGVQVGFLFAGMWGLSPIDEQVVHLGFLKAWRSVQRAFDDLVQQATGGDPEWKIYFVGHSLGGALATLAAASAAEQGRAKDKVACYTVGCPRVGNQAFLDVFSKNVPECWRMFNYRDSITYMPRSTGFLPSPGGVAFRPTEDEGGKELIKLAFVEGDAPITAVDGKPISKEAYEKLVVPFPSLRGFWSRAAYEARLVGAIVTMKGFEKHSTREYLESLISITRQAVLAEAPVEVTERSFGGLREALQNVEKDIEDFEENKEKAEKLDN